MSSWNPQRKTGPRAKHQDKASIDHYTHDNECLELGAEDVLLDQSDSDVVLEYAARAAHEEQPA